MPEEIIWPVWEPNQPLAPFMDYTLLKADAGAKDFIRLCEEAKAHNFYSVCVNGGWVRLCRERLSGTNVKVNAVIGFPFGSHATRAKAFEAAAAIDDGASEIDMVLPIGKLIDGDYETVERDIAAVVQAVQGGALVKVILEMGMLTQEQQAHGGRLAEEAGADFIQTSTGFGGAGASEADIRYLRAEISASMGIKAAGGIRSTASAVALLRAGANRIGSSSGMDIVNGQMK
ncbi:deoxyribose-phosphate aldolase [Cohnella sp.]|uniref:deoxyribose-phosphate aldolase n=1 Tax=Cohnella sp. TaxID=1883426 RepID=UPI0035697D87